MNVFISSNLNKLNKTLKVCTYTYLTWCQKETIKTRQKGWEIKKLFITSYRLTTCADIHNNSGRQKHEYITTNLQITHTLFHQQKTKRMSVNVCHVTKRKCVLCPEYAFSFFGVISALLFWTLIITTKSQRLQSVDLEKTQSCDIQNKEVNMK